MDHQQLISTIVHGRSDANISFASLRRLLIHLQFEERVRGGHHIFNRTGIVEIINLQPRGSMAKPYQVKQVRILILKYKLGASDDPL